MPDDDFTYTLLPDATIETALEKESEGYPREIIKSALEMASEYWKDHYEDREPDEVIETSQGTRFRYDNPPGHGLEQERQLGLASDLRSEYGSELTNEKIAELVQTVTHVPESRQEEDGFWETPYIY